MAITGSFKKCFEWMVDKVGTTTGSRFMIVKRMGAKSCMGINQADFVYEERRKGKPPLGVILNLTNDELAEVIRPRNVDLFKEYYLNDNKKSLPAGERSSDQPAKMDAGPTGDN